MKIDLTYQEACALMKAIEERAANYDHKKYYGDLHFDILANAYRKLDVIKKDKSRTK